MTTRVQPRNLLMVGAITLILAACSGAGAPATAAPPAGGAAGGAPASSAPIGLASQPAAQVGKSLDNFDPCSVVSDADFVAALTAETSDPSSMGKITPAHGAVDGADTGLPGAKACAQSWTTTDSAGRVNQGGDHVVVTFDLYSNLAEIQSGSPLLDDYQASGAQAFEAPGDAGDPHIIKDGYLFRMSGNSDLALLKAIALGIAARL